MERMRKTEMGVSIGEVARYNLSSWVDILIIVFCNCAKIVFSHWGANNQLTETKKNDTLKFQ